MARIKEPTDAELVEMLARRFHVTLAPAGGRTFDVLLPDLQLRVEIKLTVEHEASREQKTNFREIALATLADPNEGWRDSCACPTTRKERYSKYRGSCSKPVVGVVVYRQPLGTWDGRNYDPTKPSYSYSFRCSTHIATPMNDERTVVYRDTFLHAAKDARAQRAAALKERERLSKMTPAERIAEDARMEQRPRSKEIADEIERQIRHTLDCARWRTYSGEVKLDPNITCTCGAGDGHAAEVFVP